jgi:hypothetical protein
MLLVARMLTSNVQQARVGTRSILERNALTMNSVIALMTSHNTVGTKSILE